MQTRHEPAFRATVSAAGDGDPASVRVIVDEFSQPLIAFLERHGSSDPESAANDAIERALRNADPSRIDNRAAFRAYLYAIARNLSFNDARARKRRVVIDLTDDEAEVEAAATAETSAEHVVVADLAAQDLLQAIGPDQARVLELRFLRGMSVEETAAAMGKSVSSVNSLQHRALRRLRGLAGAVIVILLAWGVTQLWRGEPNRPLITDDIPSELDEQLDLPAIPEEAENGAALIEDPTAGPGPEADAEPIGVIAGAEQPVVVPSTATRLLEDLDDFTPPAVEPGETGTAEAGETGAAEAGAPAVAAGDDEIPIAVPDDPPVIDAVPAPAPQPVPEPTPEPEAEPTPEPAPIPEPEPAQPEPEADVLRLFAMPVPILLEDGSVELEFRVPVRGDDDVEARVERQPSLGAVRITDVDDDEIELRFDPERTGDDDALLRWCPEDEPCVLLQLDLEVFDLEDCTIVGTNRADRIFGTDGDDVICAGNGKDEIYAGQGNDVVFGGRAADWVQGGPGADRLSGGNGADVLRGGTGEDLLYGGNGRDSFRQ